MKERKWNELDIVDQQIYSTWNPFKFGFLVYKYWFVLILIIVYKLNRYFQADE